MALEKFWVWSNELTGAVPAEIWGLVNLEELRLKDNEFTDWVIPDEVGALVNMSFLDLEGCNLISTESEQNEWIPIPAALGSMVNLKSLNLSNNKLEGEIPAEIYDGLVNLQFLDMTMNSLTG